MIRFHITVYFTTNNIDTQIYTFIVLSIFYLVPELEDDDDEDDKMPAAPRSEPRKRVFNFTVGDSSPADRKVKQRLSLGDAGSSKS